jgi:hypothetical protein
VPADYTTLIGALTNVDNVKEYLRITDSGDDSFIGRLISAAQVQVAQYCRRQLISGTVTSEKHDGDGSSDTLQLREWPAASITTITVDGVALSGSDYELDTRTGQLFYKPGGGDFSPWPEGRRNIVITYVAGYTPTPADLVLGTTVHVAWIFKRTKRLGERQYAAGADVSGVFMVDAIAPEVIEIFDRYRRVET